MGFVVTEEMFQALEEQVWRSWKVSGASWLAENVKALQEFVDRHNLAPTSAVEEVELTPEQGRNLYEACYWIDGDKKAFTIQNWLAENGLRVVRDAKPVPAFDFLAHLRRQREWSERTFGPAKRTSGVVEHIRKELREIEAAPDDLEEWIDVVILALDGAWRHGGSPEQIIDKLAEKQAKNESRTWPDWRTMPEGKAIEHDRSGESKPVPADDTAKRDAKDATIAELTKRIDALELGYRDAKATNAEIQDDVDRLDAATGELLEWCKRLSREKAPAESRNPEPKAVAAERTFTEAEVRAAMRLLKSDVAIRHIFDKLGIDLEATK